MPAPIRRLAYLLLLCTAASLLPPGSAARADAPDAGLASRLSPWVDALAGRTAEYELTAHVTAPINGKPQLIQIRLARFDGDSFDLDLIHADYAVRLRRRADVTAFALPKHEVVFLGNGESDERDHLAPRELSQRLISERTSVAAYAPVIRGANAAAVAPLLTGLLGVTFDAASGKGVAGDDAQFHFGKDGALHVTAGEVRVVARLQTDPPQAAPADAWPGMRRVTLKRPELERQLVRGARRALEILAPSKALTSPQQQGRKVEHGELRWIDGQRVAILEGTPEQIGRAHGKLLAAEAEACIDSVLHTFGTVQTIDSGRWFRHDLEAAYARLSPHIPQRHKDETAALAKSLGVDPDLAQALNVFPELFHCSGFAVFDTATADGKLYHGRVLDYMTTIGLQDSATTFIVRAKGQIPFANVGYAGFIGSVSGMNARSVSLGEMGGRGEGQWDGVPMATLMRRALEECETLEEVMALWKDSPRTCEYFYVFADGKTNRAVGVAATPDAIEFIQPGQAHPLLGEGIQDAIVLSAGSRLERLRKRVKQKHGQIDAQLGMWLMSRPVAMQSNLHNVLFVPEDGVLFVANADHRRPAAERPYVRLDLNELLGQK